MNLIESVVAMYSISFDGLLSAYANPLIETITAKRTHIEGAAHTMRTAMMSVAGKSINVKRSPKFRMTKLVPRSEKTNDTELAACGTHSAHSSQWH